MLAHYGSCCACCGEAEPKFLVVDHINNDGARHREEIGQGARKIGSGSVMHAWLVANDFPDGFQLLCANCNMAKQNGGCPHALVGEWLSAGLQPQSSRFDSGRVLHTSVAQQEEREASTL